MRGITTFNFKKYLSFMGKCTSNLDVHSWGVRTFHEKRYTLYGWGRYVLIRQILQCEPNFISVIWCPLVTLLLLFAVSTIIKFSEKYVLAISPVGVTARDLWMRILKASILSDRISKQQSLYMVSCFLKSRSAIPMFSESCRQHGKTSGDTVRRLGMSEIKDGS